MKARINNHYSLYFSLALLGLMSCDVPKRMRESNLGTLNNSNNLETPNAGNAGTINGNNTPASSSEYSQCTSTYNGYAPTIGQIGVCQSSTNELNVKLTFSVTDNSDGTCIVPMYRDTSGNSTYTGRAQCTKHTANQVIYGVLVKDRSGYQQYPLNNIMVLKYSSLNAFFNCMNAYSQYGQSCAQTRGCNAMANNPVGQSQCMSMCATEATNYMNQTCSTFRNTHSYVEIRTK
jgi:hypothetical protein